jgi:YihY family inner membrane protein
MNPVNGFVRRLDRWQQDHALAAFVVAVVKKFADDQGSNLVALLTYFAFLATFPLLLAMYGILGLVLEHNPSVQQRLVDSAFSEFPVIGPQLHSQIGLSSLHHSTPALVIGLIGAVLGGRGLANAVQYAMNTLWAVPKVDRPGFPINYLRSLGLLALLAVGVCATAGAATVAGAGPQIGLTGFAVQVLTFVLCAIVDAALFVSAFRLATAKTIRTRDMILGAVLSGVSWQVLINVAGVLVAHQLRHAQSVAGMFGVVLGLLAWFALQATVTVYAIEVDVVRARRLWPRAIVQPPLTTADKRLLRVAAEAEIRRPEQQIAIQFSNASAPRSAAGSENGRHSSGKA